MNSSSLKIDRPIHAGYVGSFAMVIGLTIGIGVNIAGGQDPFGEAGGEGNVFGMPEGGAGGIFGEAPMGDPALDGAAPPTAASRPSTNDPLVEELRRYSVGNVAQQATAVRSAVQLGNWSEATAYLDLLGKRKLTDAEQAEVVGIIRPNYLLRLQQHPSLTDPQRGLISDWITGAKKHAEDRDRLKSQIALLDDPDAAKRTDAISQLRSGGLPAIAELAAAYVRPQAPVDRRRVFDVLRRFEQDAFDAMRQLALHGDPASRPWALDAVIQLDHERAMADMVIAYFDSQASDEQRRIAAVGLTQVLRSVPSAGEAEIYLGRELERASALARQSNLDAPMTRIWEVQTDKRSVSWSQVPQRQARFRDAADAAAGVLRLPSVKNSLTAAALVSDIGYRVLISESYGTQSDYTDRFGKSGATDEQKQLLREALPKAIDEENVFAAIGVIRMLAHTGDQRLVASDGANRKLLVQTAMNPIPVIRYEAAVAVSRLDYDRGYVGSSDMLHRWIEMSTLQRTPMALLLESRQAARRHQVQWLEDLGYRVVVVPTVAELVRCVEGGGDIQLIVATSQPVDRSIVETVDLVRRRSLGQMIPILIYCQNSKTLWDDDTPEAILDHSGKTIVEVVSDTNQRPRVADPFRRGPPRKQPTTLSSDRSDAQKLADLRARIEVREEQLRLTTALGQRWSAPLSVVAPMRTATMMAEQIRALVVQLPSPPLTGIQRKYYFRQGLDALLRLAFTDQGGKVYDFRSHEQELTHVVQTGGFSKAGLSLLSSLGTSASQQLLASLVASVGVSDLTRQQAAKAFAESVQRYGTRISREEVALQYERYNATATPAGRAVMGIVLDAMEQRVHATSQQP